MTVSNADGTTTPDGQPFFNVTGQVPGAELDPGESTSARPFVFDNPSLVRFTVETSVFQQTVSAPMAAVTIEVPADSLGRKFVGVGDGVILTVSAEGTAPVVVELGQQPAGPGSRGVVFYGNSGTDTTAIVTTSGGSDNMAQILARGDPANPSGFQGDLDLTASVGGTQEDTELVTVLKLNVDLESTILLNDMPVIRTVTTQPATPDLTIDTKFFRGMGGIFGGLNPNAETSLSVLVNPQGAPPIVTGPNGTASFTLQQGPGGHMWSFGEITASGSADTGAKEKTTVDTGQKKKCACGNSVALYSGEKALSLTDLTIPGRGFDYAFGRSFRSQASHFRATATGDFSVDWTISYSDDRLLQDGSNVVWLQDDLRGDTFAATETPGEFIAPVELYVSLRTNVGGDFELRDADGMVRTYRAFSDLDVPGRLIQIEDRNGNVMRFLYDQPAGLSKFVLTTVVDTMGRNIVYRYFPDNDPNVGRRGRLQEIEDFRRDNAPSGRTLAFDYDDEGNLISVTSPIVQGTPNGNDFPVGKTYRYIYTKDADIPGAITGLDRERLLHNLLSIEYPNEAAVDLDPANPQTLPTTPGTTRETLTYGTDPADPASFDRALTYTVGGSNGNGVPAGGTITYSYTFVAPVAITPNDPFLEIMVTDRRGNESEYVYSPFDTLLEKKEFTRGFRNGEPEAFVTTHSYNFDKELVQSTLPEGNPTDSTFDQDNADRFQQGNVTRGVRAPDAARGGDQTALFTDSVYEPIYQQPATVTDSRGIDPAFVPPLADPCGRTQSERYTTRYFFDYQEANAAVILPLLAAELNAPEAEVQARLDAAGIVLGLGDLNGDGDTPSRIAGNVVRIEEPTVALLAGSNQAGIEGDQCQDVVTLNRYNQFGQTTSMVDPEGNVHTNTYFPETNPDGDGTVTPAPADGRALDTSTGGYLMESAQDTLSDPNRNNGTDPTPVDILVAYSYDDVGNQTSMTDGRGIRTDYFVNELNQVVQSTRAADISATAVADPPEPFPLTDFAYVENIFYDFNDNVTIREVEDRGDTSNTGGLVDYTYTYDLLDNQTEMTEEVDVAETLLTRYRYDANENRALVIQPEGNAMTYLYDERDLLFQSTRGALNATAETLGAPGGSLDPRGGLPSTVTSNYDQNQNLIELVDAADTDGSAANNSVTAGFGDVMTYQYDGFDRRVVTIDAVGNEALVNYDAVSNVVRETRQGPIGGASPTDKSGASNVDLSSTEYQYDELNRAFQTDRVLFISAGVTTQRPADVSDGATDIGKGDLTPGDGNVTTRTEYDRKSRQTFNIEDDLDTNRTDYDGADRVIKTRDPEQNVVKTAYDDNHNVIEVKEKDVSQVGGVANEIFLTTYFYDSLDRVQRTVDNIGQTMEYRYDSRNNLVAMADAQGPVTGASITRRAFPDGALTVNDINDFGNVMLYFYDGINRKTKEERILTATNDGDGTNIGATLEGVKSTTPTPDPAQSADGIIRVDYDWDQNSLLDNLTDDNGNQTQYTYDNLNRQLTETKGISVPPALADRDDPDTTITYAYDPDDNVVSVINENGSERECNFDAINRRIDCNITRAPGVVGTTAEAYEYDGLSRLTNATDDNEPADATDDSIITYAYDSLSRVIEETQQIGGLPAKAISSAWRAENLRADLTYPNNRVIDYTYDLLDRLDTVGDMGEALPIADYDYIGVGRVAERAYPINGTRMTYLDDAGITDVGYDGLRRTVQLRHVRNDNSLVVGFTHTYDRMNNKLDEAKLHDAANSEDYDYDSVYRVTNFDRPDPGAIAPLHSDWTLDGVGNWQQVDAETRQHSSFNELITRNGTSLDHDDNGNQIDDGTFTFEWDYKNRLRTVTRKVDGLPVAVYSYDANNRRIRQVVINSAPLNGTTDFYYDGWKAIEERDGTDILVQQYVYGVYIDEALVLDRNLDGNTSAIEPSDQRLFYHQNTRYSVFALTDMGAVIVEGYQYDAYGRQVVFEPGSNGVVDFGSDDVITPGGVSALGNPYMFTGRRHDHETGLYYFRNRYWSDDRGRFISRDPMGYVDGMNLYRGYFVPMGVDPSGTEVCCDDWKAVWETQYKSYPDCFVKQLRQISPNTAKHIVASTSMSLVLFFGTLTTGGAAITLIGIYELIVAKLALSICQIEYCESWHRSSTRKRGFWPITWCEEYCKTGDLTELSRPR